MAKKIVGFIKLQVPAGKANPSPPIGPALGQRGLNIMEFCKAFNAQTQGVEPGLPLPVVITAFADKSFTFIIKTPPATVLIKKAIKLDKGSANAAHRQGRQDHARSARRNRQDQDERHDRRRHGCSCSYHRWLCPLDGRECGGRVNGQADQKTKSPVKARLTATSCTRWLMHWVWSKNSPTPSSMSPSTWLCSSALMPRSLTRWCVALSCCPTAPARPSAWRCSPKVPRLKKPRPLVPTSSVWTTWLPWSRPATCPLTS